MTRLLDYLYINNSDRTDNYVESIPDILSQNKYINIDDMLHALKTQTLKSQSEYRKLIELAYFFCKGMTPYKKLSEQIPESEDGRKKNLYRNVTERIIMSNANYRGNLKAVSAIPYSNRIYKKIRSAEIETSNLIDEELEVFVHTITSLDTTIFRFKSSAINQYSAIREYFMKNKQIKPYEV